MSPLCGSDVVSFTYDDAGRRTLTTLPNAFQTAYTYNAGGQLLGLTHSRNGTTLGDLRCGYDSAGQRIARSGSLDNTPLPNTVSPYVSTANPTAFLGPSRLPMSAVTL